MDELTLTLNSPITEEQWDAIADVDFDHTNEITFHTKHGKQVVFVKRMRGRWENGYCNKCGEHALYWAMSSGYCASKFCPNCGADMRGGQDG